MDCVVYCVKLIVDTRTVLYAVINSARLIQNTNPLLSQIVGITKKEIEVAKVEFYCNSGANIHSCRREVFDTVKDYGMEEGEWEKLTDDEKYKIAAEWANDRLEIGYKEL